MRGIELSQNIVRLLLDLGLGSPLGLVETFLPGTTPLTLRERQVFLATVETFRGVEEEIVLRDFLRYFQKLF